MQPSDPGKPKLMENQTLPDSQPSQNYAQEVKGMIGEVVHNERTSPSQNLLDPFHDHGWTYLKRGIDGHGYVLQSPDGTHVARIGSDLVPSMANALLAQQNPENPWFPKIIYHGPMQCSDQTRYVTVTPFLLKDQTGKTQEIASLLGNTDPGLPKVTSEGRAQLLADPYFVSAARQIMDTADRLSQRFADIYPAFDATAENLMRRGEQFVFTDAFRSNGETNRYPLFKSNALNVARKALGLPPLQAPDNDGRGSSLARRDPEELLTFVENTVREVKADSSNARPHSPFPIPPSRHPGLT